MHLVEVVTDAVNGAFLVFAVCDVVLDVLVCDTGTATTAMNDEQIFLTVEPQNLTRRITEAVNHTGLEAVGIVDYRTYAILAFKTVCV